MNTTSAPSRAAAIAWFEPLPPGTTWKWSPRRVSPQPGIPVARNVRSAAKIPCTVTRLPAIRGLRALEYNALGDQDAPIRPPLPGRHDRVGLLRPLVESVPFNLAQREVTSFRLVNRSLKIMGDFRHLVGRMDQLHPVRWALNKCVERHQRKTRGQHLRCIGAIDPHQAPGHRRRREMRVDDRQLVPVPHGSERVQQIGVEQGTQSFQHAISSRSERCVVGMLDSNARACDQSMLQARAIAPPLGCSLVMVRIFRQNVHSRRITPKPRSLMKAAKAAHDALPCPRGRRAAPRTGTSPNKSEMLTGTLPMVGSLCLLGLSGEIWTPRGSS